MQLRCMAAQENGSEQQLDLGRDVVFNISLERIMPDALEEHDKMLA